MNEEKYRINKTTFWMMIAVALVFDAGQIGAKIFYLIGLAAVGAFVGAATAARLGVGFEIGAAVGGFLGFLASFIPGAGQAAALGAGIALSWIFSMGFMLVGFATLWLWLLLRGVPVLGGKHMPEKFVTMLLSMIIETLPLLNAIPSITFWTTRMVLISRKEDRATDKASREKNSGKMKLLGKVRRQVQRIPVPANDNMPYEEKRLAA